MEAPWLNQLEDRVRQAIKEIGRLREENERLTAELEKLRNEIKRGESNEAWEAERVEVRERVEALAAKLEALLNDA